MKQTALDLNFSLKKTRKQVFLEQMEQVLPWAALVELIAPYYPEGRTGRPPFSLLTMLRIHFMQQWFTLSYPGMEEAFFDTPLYREFAQLDEYTRLPDESTILRFRHRLEKHKLAEQILATVNELLARKGLLLKAGTVVDATLIAAPSSTKNKGHARDPEMHSSKKGEQMYFGMKAHIGAAGVRAKVEHPFRVIKRHFGFIKVRAIADSRRTPHNCSRCLPCPTCGWCAGNCWELGHERARKQGKGPAKGETGPTGQRKRRNFREFLVKFHYLKINRQLLQLAASCSEHPYV